MAVKKPTAVKAAKEKVKNGAKAKKSPAKGEAKASAKVEAEVKVKTPAKTTAQSTAKTTEKKPITKAKTTVKKSDTTKSDASAKKVKTSEQAKSVKKTATKKAMSKAVENTVSTKHFFEIDGVQINTDDISNRIRNAYKAEGHRIGSIKSLDIYYNFAERKAYYVINGKSEDKHIEF